VQLWVPHYDELVKVLIAEGLLDPDVAPRVDAAVDGLFTCLPVDDYGTWHHRDGARRLCIGKPGTVRIRMSSDLADRLIASCDCRREFEKTRPRPQPDPYLLKQYRRAEAHIQRCWNAFEYKRWSTMSPAERVAWEAARDKERDKAQAEYERLREQISAPPPPIDEAEFAEFVERLRNNRGFLHRQAEASLIDFYSGYIFDQEPVPCGCKLMLPECDCLSRFRSKPAPGALAAPPPPQRPWGGKPLVNNELYSGRKKRWWDDKRFSGAKKNDDQIIRSHDKSASVGMRGFDAGAKGAWVNPNAEYHPEQDDRAWTRASNRTAREGEKEVQKPYDDPMGTPKSWSNPSDAAPDDELGIRRLGRRLVEEGEIERYKPKKGDEDD
jgi:hypothetical protein